MGTALALAVALCVVWLVRLLVLEVARRDRAIVARDQAETTAARRLEAAVERVGMLPDHPLVVPSAAAVEPRAEAEPCPICHGRLHVMTHDVDEHGPVRLRRLQMKCGRCGRPTTVYAEIAAPTVN